MACVSFCAALHSRPNLVRFVALSRASTRTPRTGTKIHIISGAKEVHFSQSSALIVLRRSSGV